MKRCEVAITFLTMVLLVTQAGALYVQPPANNIALQDDGGDALTKGVNETPNLQPGNIQVNQRVEEADTVPPVSAVSTTMNPLEEFCHSACKEGIAGDECNCSGHIVGK